MFKMPNRETETTGEFGEDFITRRKKPTASKFNLTYTSLYPVVPDFTRVAIVSSTALQYFVTPRLTIVMDNISSADGQFSALDFLYGDTSDVTMDREVRSRFNQRRIEMALDGQDLTVAFSNDEIDKLQKIYAQHKFIARDITILKDDVRTEVMELTPKEKIEVKKIFKEWEVRATLDMFDNSEAYEELEKEFMIRAERAVLERMDGELNDKSIRERLLDPLHAINPKRKKEFQASAIWMMIVAAALKYIELAVSKRKWLHVIGWLGSKVAVTISLYFTTAFLAESNKEAVGY